MKSRSERKRAYYLKYRATHPITYLWSKRKRVAKSRGLVFELTKEQFASLVTQACHYCGVPKGGGIDRKDSSIGYILENSLPSCRTCNVFKMAIPYGDFIERCRRIAEHTRENELD